MGMRPAVEISYLPKDQQQMLADAIEYTDATPSHDQARRLRSISKEGNLKSYIIEEVLEEEKPNQKAHISIRYEDAKRYIPDDVPVRKAGEYIMKALQYYHQHHEKKRDEPDLGI